MFKQRVVAAASGLLQSPFQCMLDKSLLNDYGSKNNNETRMNSNNNESETIFTCFAAFDYVVNSHSHKSMHLGLSCPLTNFHEACAPLTPRYIKV